MDLLRPPLRLHLTGHDTLHLLGISDDGTEIIIVADTGVTVDVLLQDAEDLKAFTPVLEMLAETAARTEI